MTLQEELRASCVGRTVKTALIRFKSGRGVFADIAALRYRGPVPGSSRTKKARTEDPSPLSSHSELEHPRTTPANRRALPELETVPASRTVSPSPPSQRSASRRAVRIPLLGLPRGMVDELLAVYFTHVHVNVVVIALMAECLAIDI